MYLKVLLLAATVATCWANLNMLELDKIPTALHRLMTISRATLDEYDSPTLPCNEEGFYSHTSDCTKFYKCIDVLGNNDYQWLAFECHAGTIFSPEYQSCISGNCSKGLTSAASVSAALASASSAVAVSAMASSNASTAASAVTSVGRQVIDSSSISSEYGISQCNSSGRFGDPDDCGKYYDCVPSHNGTFIAHEKSCLGHAFHSTLQTCVPLRMVKGCIPFSIRMLTVDPNFQVLCNNSQNKFICADCKTLVMCIEGNPYPKSCAAGNVCSMKNSSFNSGVCRPRDPVSCTCDEDYILRVDVYNSSKFLSCGIKGRDPIIYTCPKDLFFNNQCGACIKEGATCETSGPFITKESCIEYYSFMFTMEGWIHREFECRNKTLFNVNTGKCENPCNWASSTFTCKAEGRFPNPDNCTQYHECIADETNPDLYSLKEKECPYGYEWHKMANNVDHCVTKKTAMEDCVRPSRPDNCTTPNGWCTVECPEGLFKLSSGAKQCFKYFDDVRRTWDEAKTKCEEEGYELAKPLDPLALNKYIAEQDPDRELWIGGRGNGTHMVWQRDNVGIEKTDPKWWPTEENNVLTSHCMGLQSLKTSWEAKPDKPYSAWPCSGEFFTICELVE